MAFNPRETALNSLVKWTESEIFSNIEINTQISRAVADKNDISLYTFLFLGVIEKKLLLDEIIKKYSKLDISEVDTKTLNILRLGIYQLLFADKIPDHSAVDESVKLAQKRTKGYINAILRSFIRDGKKYTLPNDKWQKISIENSIPYELCSIFIDSYGEEEAEKICTLQRGKTPICLRVNTLKASCDEIIKELTLLNDTPEISNLCKDIIKTNLSISEIKNLIDSGKVFVQDESSRFATLVVGAMPNETILDACACPGGKSFSMSIDMENKGELFSRDLHQNKLSLIEKGAKNLGVEIINTGVQNAKENNPSFEEKFDRVLCDVPCSGLGVIFKKPDIKYKSVDSYRALPSVQYDILSSCSKYVKKGGILVYSTCTINTLENEKNVEKFLEENKEFSPLDFEINGIKSIKGGYTFLPHKTKTDGFFVAKMVRRND